MLCSKIMMITTTACDIPSGGAIPLATIARRTGSFVNSGTSDSIILSRPAYYKVSGTVTFTAPSTGDVVIKLLKNGEEIPGITSSATVATASTEVHTLPIEGLIRVFPSDGIASITILSSGIEITTSNVEIDIEAI